MGKTIFTDSEILMFARTKMSGVTLSREKPEFDEAPFEGPWKVPVTDLTSLLLQASLHRPQSQRTI